MKDKLKKFVGSHTFVMILFGLFYGMTAISPDLLKNPTVFGNYIGFIILNVLMQEVEKHDADREWQNKIDNLQKQIDLLRKELKNHKNYTNSGHNS